MKNESGNLTTQESLDIITSMIRQAQGNISGSSKYFLLWGWCIALSNIGMYGLTKFTSYPHPYFIWLLTIPALVVTVIYGINERNHGSVQTHLDKVTMWLWIGFCIGIIPIIAFGSKINFQINALILLLTALPTFLSGIILRFKALIIGGISLWIFSIISFTVDLSTQPLVGGIAMIIGYLIPGYMLKNLKN
jgi:hypothetical protein